MLSRDVWMPFWQADLNWPDAIIMACWLIKSKTFCIKRPDWINNPGW